jgi:dienelactone hydrolase
MRRFVVRAVSVVALLFSPSLFAQQLTAELNEEVVRAPLVIEGSFGKSELEIVVTIFRPRGAGPFPLVVLNHGSPPNAADRRKVARYRHVAQSRELVARGFVVVLPTRRGFGDTGGSFAEDYGKCDAPDYFRAGLRAAQDLLAALEYARKLSYVDRERILLVGQSAGGFASLAAASLKPAGVIGVVNFSGGRGGNPVTRPGEPCRPDVMAEAIGKYARTITVPVLWHYAENDKFFAPTHVRSWFEAFERGAAKGRLVMQPPFGKDGHSLFSADAGAPIWTAEFDRFIGELGLPPRARAAKQ